MIIRFPTFRCYPMPWEMTVALCLQPIWSCLEAKKTSIDIWNEVIDKPEKRSTRWNTQYLSSVGWVTLNNSVLDALSTYVSLYYLILLIRNL